MISILASPKSFSPAFASIQDRAIESWNRLHAEVEVILYGKDEGVGDAASRYGCHHVSDIPCSKSGVPLFNAIADHANRHARFNLQMYLNADIILPPDLLLRIAPVQCQRFVITGERIDLEKEVEWNTSEPWEARLKCLMEMGLACAHGPTGMDYFIFPRGLWDTLKPLPVGRGGYDGALLAHCLRHRIPLVDATRVLPILHQWHEYSQLPGGLMEVHHGVEAQAIRRDHDIWHSPPSVADADWVLLPGGLKSGNCRGDRLRYLEVHLRYRLRWKRLSYGLRALWRVRAKLLHSQPRAAWV